MNDTTIGIYVRNSIYAPFIQWILAGLKLYETRHSRTLHKLIGKRVALISTTSKMVLGYVTIDSCIKCSTLLEFQQYREDCMTVGTFYDWKVDTDRKYLYKLTDPEPCDPYPVPENATRHGRVWVEWN